MKNKEIIATSVFAGLMSSCCIGPDCGCDIKPPIIGSSGTTSMSANAAADSLNQAVAQGSLGVDVDKTVNDTYEGVGSDMALLLLLQAANCESKRGNEIGANQVRELARLKLLQEQNLNSTAVTKKVEAAPESLTPTENKVLENSPLKNEIIKELPPQVEVDPTPPIEPENSSNPEPISIVKSSP